MGKVINYQVVQGWQSPKGNPIDSDLFYDDRNAIMEFSSCNGERTSNAIDPATAQAAVTAAGQIGGAIAGRGKSDLKQACGRRPMLAKNRKTYDACVKKFSSGEAAPMPAPSPSPMPPMPTPSNPKKSKTMLYVGIGAGVLILFGIGYVVLKNRGRKGK